MKVAIVGSRSLSNIALEQYIPINVTEIVSGGAVGVDLCAMKYAKEKALKLTEFFPQYELYGRAAPIVRNKAIVDYSDKILIFWNGNSKGTLSVINFAKKSRKPYQVILCK